MAWVGIVWNECGDNWHYTGFGCKQGKLLLSFKAFYLASFLWGKKGISHLI